MRAFKFIFIGFLFVTSCKSNKEIIQQTDEPKIMSDKDVEKNSNNSNLKEMEKDDPIEGRSKVNKENTEYPKVPAITATIGDTKGVSSPIKIDTVFIEGNTMFIKVGYTGGCGEHIFSVVGNQSIAKSLPPIRNIKLFHKIENDNCEKYITRKIEVKIEQLAYQKTEGSEIYLSLEGYPHKILYTYSENNK